MINILRLLCLCLVFSAGVSANEKEQQYDALLKELRCVTCPNQSLADSSMPIAMGMKAEIYQQIQEKKSSSEIKAFFVEKYGKSVLYKPPYDRTTFLLWLGPFFLLLAIIALWRRQFKSRVVHG